jgi:hypothetical protein
VQDFLSQQALGRRSPAPDDHDAWRVYDGVSVFDSPAGAWAMVDRYPRMGSLLAVLDVPDGDERIRYDKTRGPGHYTLWGQPQNMLDRVVSIVRR